MIFLKGTHFTKIAYLLIASGFLSLANARERHSFNDKEVPDSIEDIIAIEKSLLKNLERTRSATVSLTNGQGSGSGVIVSKDGIIMTAAHVTAGVNKEMTVIMEDGTKYKAISLGLDSETDAALMKITDPGEYPFVKVDRNPVDSMTTKLGDWVYSLGHSGGYDKARGSVVRLGRIVRVNNASATFQSDCKLIGGDSGGPLFNMNGVLIGIHSRVGRVLDQNMHVCSYDFENKWSRLLKGEFIGKGPFAQPPVLGSGFMGFSVERFEKPTPHLKLKDVDETSPAGKAGLKIGDTLLKINGKEIKVRSEIAKFMKSKAEGDKVKVTISRDGKEIEVELKLSQR